jgi:Asp-tRNA(Asn)/Glu-tRNA(Gln) amidotransferase A subunit family amidase
MSQWRAHHQGLTIGLMIYGKALDEAMVLRVGYAFE